MSTPGGKKLFPDVGKHSETFISYIENMRLFPLTKQTLGEVSDASKTVINTSEWATVALIAVAAVSLLALGIGIIALGKATHAN